MRYFVMVSDLVVVPPNNALVSLDDGTEYRVGHTFGPINEPENEMIELYCERRIEPTGLRLKPGAEILVSSTGVPAPRPLAAIVAMPKQGQVPQVPPEPSSVASGDTVAPSTSNNSETPPSEEPPAS